MSAKEIVDLEDEDIRTIQNDAKAARGDLTALVFGLDGVFKLEKRSQKNAT